MTSTIATPPRIAHGPRRSFHWLETCTDVPPPRARGRPPAPDAPTDPLVIPPGLSYLCWPRARAGRPRLSTRRPRGRAPVFVLEEVRVAGRAELLLLSPADHRPRVNGWPAPRVAVLCVRDVVRFEHGQAFHVTAYVESGVMRATEAQAGETCPVCRDRVRLSRQVYVCPSCWGVMHLDDDAVDPGERLSCALQQRACARCAEPVRREAGYEYLPEEGP